MMKRPDFIKNTSKSWADIATSSNYKSSTNDWPDLKEEHKRKSAVKTSEHVKPASTESISISNLTNVMKKLSTKEIEQANDGVNLCKSREEITAERKLRRKAKKIEQDEKLFQEKLAQIREPKTQKVKVIDKFVMERYLQNEQLNSHSRIGSSRLKYHSAIKVNLSDLINVQMIKPVDKSYIRNQQTLKVTNATQRHKGKRREFQKKKYLSKLKRSILLSRLLRKQGSNEVSTVVQQTGIDLNTAQCNEDKESAIKEQTELTTDERNKTTDVVSPISLNIKFSRKFRPYCDNFTTPELCKLTEALLLDIFRFQDRAYNKNQIKARSQKRYVVGFKETIRQLDIGKVKLLIIAPDLEQSTESGGINDTIDEMKQKCQKSNVPYVFSLKRRRLGYVLLKKVPVSCVGVLNYQGSEENSQKLLTLIQEEKFQNTPDHYGGPPTIAYIHYQQDNMGNEF